MASCCGKYNAGMLREPVTVERNTKSSDGAGGWTSSWAAVSGAPDRASVKAVSGSERFASERVEAATRWRMVCRYFSGLKESDRVVIRSKAYNIRFINNVELADQWLEIDLDGGVAIP